MPDLEEVVIDDANDMETVGNDFSVAEIFAGNTPVGLGKVHHHDPDFSFVRQLVKGRSEGRFRAPKDDVIDFMAAKVTKSRGIALFAGKEVLIDTEDPGARIILASGELQGQEIPVTALDRSLSNLKATGEKFLTDAVVVFLEDFFSKGLSASPVRKNARKTVVKIPAAGLAKVFVGPKVKINFSRAKAFVSNPAVESILDP